jgi:phosphoribosyl 1,2-cyclic phosphodiesterase
VKVVPLGVRGSTAAPGAEFVAYGGHTSCVAVTADNSERPSLVLDAGTGLRDLPALLGMQPFRGDIVLTHLHWDHVQGLPFCPAVDNPDACTVLHVPTGEEQDPGQLLARSFAPPFFPITPDGLLGKWDFRRLATGPVRTMSEACVSAAPVAHKGGLTFGVRIELDGRTLAYLPDHAWHPGSSERLRASAVELASGADLLLHDGQFTDTERARSRLYGHSTIEGAAEFSDRCEVGALAITHHSPDRTDAELEQLAKRFRCTPQGRPIRFLQQGQAFTV